MKAINIEWSQDMDFAYERLDEMEEEAAAKAIELSVESYKNLTTEERHDLAEDYWRHRPGKLDEFMGCPSEVEIPENLTTEDEITAWLCYEYGAHINGYKIQDGEKVY